MNRFLARTLGIAWWLAPLAVAAFAIGVEVDWGRQWRRVPAPAVDVAPRPVTVAVLPDYSVPGGLAARPETTARTLFNPTRRPAPTPTVEAPKPTMKRGQFTLTGTMEIDGKSTAFLRETSGGKSRRVLQGELINGLLVAEVTRDRVRLALGEESEELVLKVATGPKPGQPPAAAARPPVAPPAVAAQPVPAVPASREIEERRRAMREEIARQQAEAAAAAANPAGAASPPPPELVDPRWTQEGTSSGQRTVTPNRRNMTRQQ